MNVSRRVHAVLKQLPQDWEEVSPESFAKWIEEFHSERVQFVPMGLKPGLFACCLVVADKDDLPVAMVVYNSDLPLAHQLHVQMHELAHLALGHPTWTGSTEDLELLLHNPPQLNLVIKEFACRATNQPLNIQSHSPEELEAEDLTRELFKRAASVRREKQLKRISSQSNLEESLRRMGIE